ncbi:T9SS type B sorting domain-containing protein [Gramella sp. BOM4]|nr:T9SS type B sorting domain-containing protein [Christiangramia bathymodioli]
MKRFFFYFLLFIAVPFAFAESDSSVYLDTHLKDLESENFCSLTEEVIDDWVKCDDHSNAAIQFLLTEKDNEILDGRNASDYTISYYYSQNEAASETGGITDEIPVQPRNDISIYYRLESNNDPTCFIIGDFDLKVIRTEVRMDELEFCGNSEGFHQFKLSDLDDGMLNHQFPPNDQDAAIHEVSYYLTEADAENQVNELDKDQWTNTVPDYQTIYVRVQRTDEFSCYHVKFFDLYINRKPEDPQASNEFFCLEDPANFLYDLNLKNPEILDGADPEKYNILYFSSEEDANARTGNFSLIDSSQADRTIYFRIENRWFNGCYETGSFQVDIKKGVQASTPQPISECAQGTGQHFLDLSEKDIEIIGNQDPDKFQVAYFYNQEDANTHTDEIPKENFGVQPGSMTLYAKLIPQAEGCSSLARLEIKILSPPQPELQASYSICPENDQLELDGGNFDSWEWLNEDGAIMTTSRNITISNPGNYSLKVTKTEGATICENSISFSIEEMEEIANFTTNMERTATGTKLEISVHGTGDYEFSIDGENFQNSNVFNLDPGEYQVYARSLNGCGSISRQVVLPGYPEFFTPNGDGINDKWNIVATEDGNFLDVQIYDRYGKLLAQILGGKFGWDGTFNGKPMPTDDYWFLIQPKNSEKITGHFSLIRQ